jgi:DegV family protein with EDD domain
MIHLVTDSTAGLLPEIKSKYNVHTISLKLCVGDQTYNDEGGITQEAFYELLESVETTPTTSQPSAGEFMELYEQLTRGGDEVISIHISEGLSGTVPNALAAVQQVAPDRISVVDSHTAAMGLIILVVAAGEAIAAGKDRAHIVAMLERMVEESEAIFFVEDLAYLHKGGRIGGATRFIGTLLNIKPILYMSEGKIEALDKARSARKAKERVVDEIAQRMGQRPVRVGVGHILAPEAAAEMAEMARQKLNCVWCFTSEVGPVIGTHVGPGFAGIAACPVLDDMF